MKDTLIAFDTAKLAKEKGFNYETFLYYINNGELCSEFDRLTGVISGDYLTYDFNSLKEDYYSFRGVLEEHISAPTQTQLQKWLRETHNIHVVMKPVLGSKNGYDSYPMLGWDYDIMVNNRDETNSYYMGYPIGEWFTA